MLLPGWCAPRREHGIAVIAAAAGAALAGTGCRVIAARLGVATGTVRGCLRARAEPLRCHAARQLAAFDPHAWLPPADSPLGDALAALHAARARLGYRPHLTWALLGALGLGHALMPAPGG